MGTWVTCPNCIKNLPKKYQNKKERKEVHQVTCDECKNNVARKHYETGVKRGIWLKKWKKESPETKSNILMKFVGFCVEQEEKKDDTKRKTKENTFLSYIWSFQGLLANLGRDYETNPKNLRQLKQNGIRISSNIEYSEVVELYDKLTNEKYKVILKVMMYSGLNPIDILQFKPINFNLLNGSIKKKLNKELRDTDFYYVNKQRTKTERKNISFLLVFTQNFFNEIKNYFERPITININKNGSEKTNKKIEKLTNETYIIEVDKKKIKKNRYAIELNTENTIRFVGKYHWDYDKNINLFGKFSEKSPTTVADAFRYCVDKHGLNEHLKPYNIRSLCFTLLKDVFTFKDENIYQVWTQHKIKGLVDRNYITNTMDTLINKYLKNIEANVLIGSLKETLEKANEFKEKADAVKDNTEEIDNLKLENNRLLTKLNKTNDTIKELKTELEEFNIVKNDVKTFLDLLKARNKDKTLSKDLVEFLDDL